MKLTNISSAIESAYRHDSYTVSHSREITADKITNAEYMMQPIRDFFQQLRSGVVDAVRGEPVHVLGNSCFPAVPAITGWLEFARRVSPSIDYRPIERVAKRLNNGIPIYPSDIDAVFSVLDAMQIDLVKLPRAEIQDKLTSAQIQIEIERLLLKPEEVSA